MAGARAEVSDFQTSSMSGTAPAPADLGQPGEQVNGAEPVSESYLQGAGGLFGNDK